RRSRTPTDSGQIQRIAAEVISGKTKHSRHAVKLRSSYSIKGQAASAEASGGSGRHHSSSVRLSHLSSRRRLEDPDRRWLTGSCPHGDEQPVEGRAVVGGAGPLHGWDASDSLISAVASLEHVDEAFAAAHVYATTPRIGEDVVRVAAGIDLSGD